jgi:hypothetical protein
MSNNNNEDRVYDWGQSVDSPAEGGEYTLLPPGKYPFTVKNWSRGYHDAKPDGKIGSCPMAIVTVEIDGGELGSTKKDMRFFLHSRCNGLTASFFASIGLRKHGEPLVFDFNRAVGRRGMCKVRQDPGIGDKADRMYNDVDQWVYPGEDSSADNQTAEIPF